MEKKNFKKVILGILIPIFSVFAFEIIKNSRTRQRLAEMKTRIIEIDGEYYGEIFDEKLNIWKIVTPYNKVKLFTIIALRKWQKEYCNKNFW